MSQTMSQADFCGVNTRSSDLVHFWPKKNWSKRPGRMAYQIIGWLFKLSWLNRSSDAHLGPSRSKTDDDQESIQGGVVQMMRNVSTYNSSASSQPNIKWIVLAPEGPLSIPASDPCQGLQTALNHSILYGYDLKVFRCIKLMRARMRRQPVGAMRATIRTRSGCYL